MQLFHVIFQEPEMNILLQPCRGEGRDGHNGGRGGVAHAQALAEEGMDGRATYLAAPLAR